MKVKRSMPFPKPGWMVIPYGYTVMDKTQVLEKDGLEVTHACAQSNLLFLRVQGNREL